MNYSKSIDQLCTSHDVVLVDTCSITFGNGKRDIFLRRDKIKANLGSFNSYIFWKNNFQKFGGKTLYVVEEIKGEIEKGLDGRVPSKKEIKENRGKRDKKNLSNTYRSTILRSMKSCKGLVQMIEKKEAVLKFGGKKNLFYEGLLKECLFLKDQNSKLDSKDYALFIAGMNSALFRKKTLLISNDTGIEDAWKELISRYPLLKNYFKFGSRCGKDEFKVRY